MNNDVTVLILTAPFGNGHVSVAKEIKHEFEKRPNVKVVMYDLYTEEYYRFTQFLKKYHLRQYKKGISQRSYKYFYYKSGRLLETRLGRIYQRFGMKQLIQKVKSVQPDLILNTFPVNCSYFLQEEGFHIPVFTMITDYYANENWIHPNLNCHFVASENVVEQLLSKGISQDQIELTGIPVREPFNVKKTEAEINALKEQHQINPDHKVVLAVAGAKGVLPKFKRIAERLSQLDNLTLLLVCGSQQKLYQRLTKRFEGSSNVRVFPYVTDIENLMAISDLMVTKPGGITITECAQMGLPLVLFKPIYGQELENARYFEKKGAAVVRYKEDDLIQAVNELIKDNERLKDMKVNISNIAQENSTERIVGRMLAELGENNGDQTDLETSI